MPRKPIRCRIGQLQFASLGEAGDYFAAMLRRYQHCQRVVSEDATELLALLRCHPDAAEKLAPGVEGFVVMSNRYGTLSFRVLHREGQTTDFSIAKCIRGARLA